MERRTGEVRGCSFRLKRTKLNYCFHNPNSAEDTADLLCRLMIEVNAGKVERAIEKAATYVENEEYILVVQEKYVNDNQKINPKNAISRK